MNKNQKLNEPPRRLGEILIYYKLITSTQLEKALKVKESSERRLGEILIDKGIVTQDEINWVLSKQLNIPYVNINIDNINHKLSENIPEFTLKKFKILPLMELDNGLVVAMADPTDKEALETIKDITKRKLIFVLASFKNIDETIDKIFKKRY